LTYAQSATPTQVKTWKFSSDSTDNTFVQIGQFDVPISAVISGIIAPFTKHGVIFMKLNGIELLNLAVAHELKEVWVVRLDPPDQPGNRGPAGDLLWPEVLLCKNSDDATHLAEYLSKAAFDDLTAFMAAEIGDFTLGLSDTDQYIVALCKNIDRYRYAWLIEPSLKSIQQIEILKKAFHHEK